MSAPAGEIPAAIGTALKLETGEILLVPAELNGAVAQAWGEAADQGETAAEWRTAFGAALVRALHRDGLILVARARRNSREAVNADIYSLALAGKYAAETRLEAYHQARRARRHALASRVAGIIVMVLSFIVAPALLYTALCCGLDDRGHLIAALIIVGTVVTIGWVATRLAYRWLTRGDRRTSTTGGA